MKFTLKKANSPLKNNKKRRLGTISCILFCVLIWCGKRDFRPWRPLPTNSPPDCLVLSTLRSLEQIASAIFSLLQVPFPLQNKKSKPYGLLFLLVRETGLEPVHQRYTPLKRARLPIPPLPRGTLPIIHERISKVKGFCEKIFYFFQNRFFRQKVTSLSL